MAGLVPAIPMLRGAALQTIGITGTRPAMPSRIIGDGGVSPVSTPGDFLYTGWDPAGVRGGSHDLTRR
jgi:hypothetical protein